MRKPQTSEFISIKGVESHRPWTGIYKASDLWGTTSPWWSQRHQIWCYHLPGYPLILAQVRSCTQHKFSDLQVYLFCLTKAILLKKQTNKQNNPTTNHQHRQPNTCGLHYTIFFLQKPTKSESYSFYIEGLFKAVKDNARSLHPLRVEELHHKYHKVNLMYYNLDSTKPTDPLVL